MTDMTLLSKLEQATAGSRELDAAIAEASRPGSVESDDGDFWWGAFDEKPQRVPHYTTSLDAALSLAKGEDIDEIKLWNDCGMWFTTLRTQVSSVKYVETRSEFGCLDAALDFCAVFLRHLAALEAREEA